jgi:retron-type reverse transcriptase
MNRQQVSALVLLDLSAAFDTIDHNILLNRLRSTFGISDTAFTLLSSYLSNRSQSVAVDNEFSNKLPLLRGVPQGSVLGPLLFSLYTTPLSHILADSSIQFHFYADDTQLYVSFSGSDSSQSLANFSSTLHLVHS